MIEALYSVFFSWQWTLFLHIAALGALVSAAELSRRCLRQEDKIDSLQGEYVYAVTELRRLKRLFPTDEELVDPRQLPSTSDPL